MNARNTAIAVATTAIAGAGLSAAPASAASATSVAKRCAGSRATTYKLKASDGAYLKKYLKCVLAADGLTRHVENTMHLYPKSPSSGSGLGANLVPISLSKLMASTIAGFVSAPRSDENWRYIDTKVADTYQETGEGPIAGYFTMYGDTTSPSPSLQQVASWIAPARSTIESHSHRQLPLAVDVVVQPGVWFHDGRGANLRFIVLLKAV